MNTETKSEKSEHQILSLFCEYFIKNWCSTGKNGWSRSAISYFTVCIISLRGGLKIGLCPSVCPCVTLLVCVTHNSRRKCPIGLGIFVFDRARSEVVHRLLSGGSYYPFGRGKRFSGKNWENKSLILNTWRKSARSDWLLKNNTLCLFVLV